MKKVKYKGREIVLDGEESLNLARTKRFHSPYKLFLYSALASSLFFGYGLKEKLDANKALGELKASRPQEYVGYVEARDNLNLVSKYLGVSAQPSLDSRLNSEDMDELYGVLSAEEYNQLSSLREKDGQVESGINNLLSEYIGDYRLKKFLINKDLKKTELSGNKWASLIFGGFFSLFFSIVGGLDYSKYRWERRGYIKDIAKKRGLD